MARPRTEQPTPGELEILKVLWRRGPSTVRQVLEEINKDRPRAYTSAMSLLNVMVDKGLLRRSPRGKAFLYTAAVEEKLTMKRLVGDLVERVFGGSPELLIAHALEQTDPSPGELENMQRMISEYRTRHSTQNSNRNEME